MSSLAADLCSLPWGRAAAHEDHVVQQRGPGPSAAEHKDGCLTSVCVFSDGVWGTLFSELHVWTLVLHLLLWVCGRRYVEHRVLRTQRPGAGLPAS